PGRQPRQDRGPPVQTELRPAEAGQDRRGAAGTGGRDGVRPDTLIVPRALSVPRYASHGARGTVGADRERTAFAVVPDHSAQRRLNLLARLAQMVYPVNRRPRILPGTWSAPAALCYWPPSPG